MRKVLLLTGLIASMAVSAMAAGVPVTNIYEGDSRVGLDYGFGTKVSSTVIDSSKTGHAFGATLDTALSDKVAVQYGFNKAYFNNDDFKDHQLTGIYKIHPNFNLYGAGTYLDMQRNYSGFGYQVGVIGHKELTDRIDGFAKVGVGNDVKNTVQIGGTYALKPDIDLNVYYEYDKYELDHNRTNAKGLHAGVGYTF